ncbi:MAG: class I SAM-dependent methyltransferase [Myxococcales bacterium]|nr:class I SAM-dependent methyltransferase [Deltaproteobacteria bacterium]NNE20410.1 class I SAM-dependent methyltransferase [Myxococcales bacterium]
MNNQRNRFVYRLWAPVYDAVLGRLFQQGRRRAMEQLGLKAGERLCLVGVGTGADLLHLPKGVNGIGVDLSEAMLDRAKKKLPIEGCDIELRVGDAQALPLDDRAFDAVILNLILSVVPDPALCMSEAIRVLRPGGRIVIFDKFLPDGTEPTWGRRLANLVSTRLGTDLNRRLGDILSGFPCEVARDEPSILGGMYRVVLIRQIP